MIASLLAAVITIYLPLQPLIQWPVILAILLTAVMTIRRHVLLTQSNAVSALSLSQSSKLQLTYQDGREVEVMVLASSFVTAYLTILNLRDLENGRQVHLLLLPDNTDAEAFRQLRVWLRWGYDELKDSVDST